MIRRDFERVKRRVLRALKKNHWPPMTLREITNKLNPKCTFFNYTIYMATKELVKQKKASQIGKGRGVTFIA